MWPFEQGVPNHRPLEDQHVSAWLVLCILFVDFVHL